MTNTISVVPACPDDLLLLTAIGRETFADTFAPYNTAEDMQAYTDQYFTASALRKELRSAGHQFLLAMVADECAGYALIREEDAGNMRVGSGMELARLYARKTFIGKGIGKRLMNYVIHTAKEKGKEWLWLGVWEFNLPAIRFYRSCGFEKFSEHDFVLGTDVQRDWLMRRAL